jgi:hypothetical protein
MAYVPPNGWIQTRIDGDATVIKFHTRSDCARIRAGDALRQVDKPYSAARCSLCADATSDRVQWAAAVG